MWRARGSGNPNAQHALGISAKNGPRGAMQGPSKRHKVWTYPVDPGASAWSPLQMCLRSADLTRIKNGSDPMMLGNDQPFFKGEKETPGTSRVRRRLQVLAHVQQP